MANIDLGNLTRYDGKIKEYAEDKYLSKNTANWQMTEKAGAVTCYPVPDTELEPIVDFSFKETLPASGDKSPSNPSTIEGVNKIKVTRCGKNLLKRPYQTTAGSTIYTTTFTVDSETGIVTGNTPTSSTNNASFWLEGSDSNIRLVGGNTYYLSGCPSGGSENTYRLGCTIYSLKNEPTGPSYYDNSNGVAFTPATDCHFVATATVRAGATVSNLIFKPQLELGSIATTYEFYSGNDYIIQLDNTYYCGSVNLATGMMTVTWQGFSFTGEENWQYSEVETTGYYRYALIGKPDASSYDATKQKCTHFDYLQSWNIGSDHFYVATRTNLLVIISSISSLDSFKSWLAQQYANDTPVTLTYELKNPFTVQLDPVQIKSLTALDKNTPRLNTLYTDADSIQVGYQKHPARTSYELENAILALGGGE